MTRHATDRQATLAEVLAAGRVLDGGEVTREMLGEARLMVAIGESRAGDVSELVEWRNADGAGADAADVDDDGLNNY